MNEREAMAILVSAQKIGYGRRERALSEARGAMELLADPFAYAHILGAEGAAALRRAMKESSRLLETLDASGVQLVLRGEAGYPPLLEKTAHAPHLLFVMGRARLDDLFPFAVVGTRRAGAYGLRHTRIISQELTKAGVTIVSGMALGIDAAAHWGALDVSGRTVAVLGSALDKPYPAENRTLMRRILESGGSVISEYPPGTEPTRYSFIQRNRIVAGMSLGVLVSEAPMKSGAQSTVRLALDEGREVFAVPGDIDRVGSQLPNRLIAEGAHMTVCAQDILNEMVIEPKKDAKKNGRGRQPAQMEQQAMALNVERAPARSLDAQEKKVYDLLLAGDMDFDALSEKTGIASDELGGVLMMLELDGVIESLPGLSYRLA